MEESMTTTNIRNLLPAAIVLVMVEATAGCSLQVGEAVGSQDDALSSGCAPTVPPALAVPEGNKLAFHLDAIGVQIYGCQATATGPAWVFSAPEARLLNHGGHVVGTHYAGPTWEAKDGSKVVGARVAGATVDPTAIPWLLLSAASHEGNGRMQDVTFIQRLDTAGGLAPSTGCDADHVGAVVRVDYAATYFFYVAGKAPPSHGQDD
jgi:hypothetical protein